MAKLFNIFHENQNPQALRIINFILADGATLYNPADFDLASIATTINEAVREDARAVKLTIKDVPADLLPRKNDAFHVDDDFDTGLDFNKWFPAVIIVSGFRASTTNEDLARAYILHLEMWTV